MNGRAFELLKVSSMTEPCSLEEVRVRFEAIIESREGMEKLDLQIWISSQSGSFYNVARIETKAPSPGERMEYSTDFTLERGDNYIIHTYLHEGAMRIAHKSETISI